MRATKKDYTFEKVMETQKELKDTDGFDWLESTELVFDKRKFLLNRFFVKQPIPQDEDVRPAYPVQHCAQYCAQHPSLDVAQYTVAHFVQHYAQYFGFL